MLLQNFLSIEKKVTLATYVLNVFLQMKFGMNKLMNSSDQNDLILY